MMRKIVQTKTPGDFIKLNRAEFHQLWFNESLTDGQIAKMFGVTKKDVKEKRKQLKLTYINSGLLFLTGGEQYADSRKIEKKKEKQKEKILKQINKEKKHR